MSFVKLVSVVGMGVMLSACGGNKTVKQTSGANSQFDAVNEVNIAKLTRIVPSGMIDQRVLNECGIVTQFPELLQKIGLNHGIKVNIVDDLDKATKGYNLDVEYNQIISSGNAFLGHRKYTQIHLGLYKEGKKISESDAGRRSGGGVFAGFKGSCSVIGRTVEANAKDTIFWLKNPYNGAQLGNL